MDGDEAVKCVAKPCITAEDECYNCEWSTELYVPPGFCRVCEGLGSPASCWPRSTARDPDGFVFNMSVGYDLAGIQSEDRQITSMRCGMPPTPRCGRSAWTGP